VVEKLIMENLWRDAVANRLALRDQRRIATMAQSCFEEVEPALRDNRPPDENAGETRP